jgi:hypothetical protein
MNRLSPHFRSQADEVRVARVWAAVDHRLQRQRRLRPWLRGLRGALYVAAATAAMLLIYFRSEPARTPRVVSALPQLLELPDGSRVEHAPEDRIGIEAVTATRVELRMTRGRARFRVAPNHERSFLTHAAGYTIRVVGTEFVVDLGPAGLRVEVSRGVVEVRRDQGADVWRVRAGETWSSSLPAPEVPKPLASAAPATPVEPPRSAEPQAPHATHTESVRASHGHGQNVEAAALFQRAQDARAAGSSAETARLLDELLRRFPSDARAGLAAFQLGRLRLDSGDAKGALEALDRAQNAGSSFQEQVAARRVQALEQLGDTAACRSARTAFLRDYPGGSFAEVVRRRCP